MFLVDRYWSLIFAGSVLDVENSLAALPIWPLQLNHMCDRQSRASCPPPPLPWRQLARPPVSSA